MNRISKRTLITAVVSFCLWIIAGFFLYRENNGKVILILIAVALLMRIIALIKKDRKINVEGSN